MRSCDNRANQYSITRSNLYLELERIVFAAWSTSRRLRKMHWRTTLLPVLATREKQAIDTAGNIVGSIHLSWGIRHKHKMIYLASQSRWRCHPVLGTTFSSATVSGEPNDKVSTLPALPLSCTLFSCASQYPRYLSLRCIFGLYYSISGPRRSPQSYRHSRSHAPGLRLDASANNGTLLPACRFNKRHPRCGRISNGIRQHFLN